MNERSSRHHAITVEPWMLRLKSAFDAGYYRTEAAEGEQTRFPWQDRVCGDCPFWSHSMCLVREARRGARDATCRYFDEWNYAEAESIIQYNKIRPIWPRVEQHEEDQAA